MHPLTALTLDGASALVEDGEGQLQLQTCCTGMNLLACLCRCCPGRPVMIGASALGLAVSQNLEHHTDRVCNVAVCAVAALLHAFDISCDVVHCVLSVCSSFDRAATHLDRHVCMQCKCAHEGVSHPSAALSVLPLWMG